MRIGELAQATGVSTRTLRYYEQQHLIVSARRDNGYREYDESTITRVRNIRSLLDAGLTCDEIRQLTDCLGKRLEAEPVCDKALELYRTRLRKVEGRIVALLDAHERVQRTLEELEGARHRDTASPKAV
ncbi:MerR family transcriptional regulator [Allorhizocola rhizosphaerae]|uniref:MerR family transcriptional regulator n=1 Tax=Allorhizocola rhizosphaerae TaxID=1872709 RepID=UPI000E3B9266|nr:MerR family transcriptional regulator [Allorhizocola rhizosphaerae]